MRRGEQLDDLGGGHAHVDPPGGDPAPLRDARIAAGYLGLDRYGVTAVTVTTTPAGDSAKAGCGDGDTGDEQIGVTGWTS